MSSSLTVGYLVNIVRKAMQDNDDVLFTDSELLGFFNMSTRLIISLDPSAYTINEVLLLIPNSAKQYGTSDCIRFLEVLRNMGSDGATPGNAITMASLASMRSMHPGFSSDIGSAEIEQFMPIPDSPTEFFVYPPAHETTAVYVEVRQAKMPTTVQWDDASVWESSTIPLSDRYASAYVNAMLYMAYRIDSDLPGSAEREGGYYGKLLTELGVGGQQ